MRLVGIDSDERVLTSYRCAMRWLLEAYDIDGFTVITYAAEIGTVAFDFPPESTETGTILFHASPPCQVFSRARISTASPEEHEKATAVFRGVLQVIADRRYQYFSVENVHCDATCALVDEFQRQYPHVFEVASRCKYDAVHYGCPSSRVRLFATSPAVAAAMLSNVPRCTLTVREALSAHGFALPSEHVSNGNRTNGVLVSKQVDGPCHTLTASHALSWCTAGGALIRGLRKQESLCLMGFHQGFPVHERACHALRAIGNSIPPCMAAAVVTAMLHVKDAPEAAPVTAPIVVRPPTMESVVYALRAEVETLKRKVAALETP